MSLDCAQLHACAELLHEQGAELMERVDLSRREAVAKLQLVAAVEEVAAEVEAKIAEDC